MRFSLPKKIQKRTAAGKQPAPLLEELEDAELSEDSSAVPDNTDSSEVESEEEENSDSSESDSEAESGEMSHPARGGFTEPQRNINLFDILEFHDPNNLIRLRSTNARKLIVITFTSSSSNTIIIFIINTTSTTPHAIESSSTFGTLPRINNRSQSELGRHGRSAGGTTISKLKKHAKSNNRNARRPSGKANRSRTDQ